MTIAGTGPVASSGTYNHPLRVVPSASNSMSWRISVLLPGVVATSNRPPAVKGGGAASATCARRLRASFGLVEVHDHESARHPLERPRVRTFAPLPEGVPSQHCSWRQLATAPPPGFRQNRSHGRPVLAG